MLVNQYPAAIEPGSVQKMHAKEQITEDRLLKEQDMKKEQDARRAQNAIFLKISDKAHSTPYGRFQEAERAQDTILSLQIREEELRKAEELLQEGIRIAESAYKSDTTTDLENDVNPRFERVVTRVVKSFAYALGDGKGSFLAGSESDQSIPGTAEQPATEASATVNVYTFDTKSMGLSDVDVKTKERAKGAAEKLRETSDYLSKMRESLVNEQSLQAEKVRAMFAAKEEPFADALRKSVLSKPEEALRMQASSRPERVLALIG